MTILILIVGLILLLCGASLLVDSSVAIAKRLHVSDFIIGLTIVGMGTSAPELYVSVTSALRGMGDVAIGNVLGSNVCNVLLILGVTAAIRPVAITDSNLRRDVLLAVVASLLLVLLCYIGDAINGVPLISRVGGLILLAGFAIFMWMAVANKKGSEGAVASSDTSSDISGRLNRLPVWGCIVVAFVSLGMLIGGGNLFLDSSVSIARSLGVSEFVISVTIIAVGTSLPELATCVIAALRGNGALALGNVLGSNVFNIFLIVGTSAVISPLKASGVGIVDFAMLVGSTVMVALCAYTGKRMTVDRFEGVIMLLLYGAYMTWLVLN